MVYEVVYTPQFENDFVELMDCLIKNWSENVAKQFGNQLDELIQTLSKMPLIGKKSLQNPLVRGITVTDKKIMLIPLVDTRQNV